MSEATAGERRDRNEDDEFMWVKAGTPGEKPTILRSVRSAGSFDLLQVNHPNKDLVRPVSAESCVIVLDVDEAYPARTLAALLNSPALDRRRNEQQTSSRTKTDHSSNRQRYPSEVQDSGQAYRTSSLPTENRLHKNQPTPLKPIQIQHLKKSPNTFARHRAKELSQIQQAQLSRDDGYTSLSEDAKELDSDTNKRTHSLPSSWRPRLSDHQHEPNLHTFARRMTSNEQKIDASNPGSSAWCDSTQSPCSKPLLSDRTSPEEPSPLMQKSERVLEYCTCFLCLRSAVYHCVEEDDSDSIVDHPCDCSPTGKSCCRRWTLIGMLTCLFPFLLCYPPIKGCMNLNDYRIRRKKRRRDMKRRRTGEARVGKLTATTGDKRHILQNGDFGSGKSGNLRHPRHECDSAI